MMSSPVCLIVTSHLMFVDVSDITVSKRIEMLLDIARGMTYLHKRQPPIIHRDLTSFNILVDKDFHCKVADFGMSRAKDMSNMTRQPGNLRWMAPEVTLQQEYDEAADVFSFALIIWEVFSRSLPLHTLQPAQVSFAVLHCLIFSVQAAGEMAYRDVRPPILSADICPSAITTLMQKCWAKDPKERPDFPSIVDFLLQAVEQQDVPHAPSSIPAPPLSDPYEQMDPTAKKSYVVV